MTHAERAERIIRWLWRQGGSENSREDIAFRFAAEIAAAVAEAMRPANAPELVAIAKRKDYPLHSIVEATFWLSKAREDVDTLLSHVAYLQGMLTDCQEESTAYQRGVQAGLERAAVVCTDRGGVHPTGRNKFLAAEFLAAANVIRRQRRCEACRGVGMVQLVGRHMQQCGACQATGWTTAKEATS